MLKPRVTAGDYNEDDSDHKYSVGENLFESKESVTQSAIVDTYYSIWAFGKNHCRLQVKLLFTLDFRLF